MFFNMYHFLYGIGYNHESQMLMVLEICRHLELKVMDIQDAGYVQDHEYVKYDYV